MLSDFERKQMRERKKREEAAKAPAGRMALQYAEQQKKAAAERERILAMYTDGGTKPEPPAEQKPKTEMERILDLYK